MEKKAKVASRPEFSTVKLNQKFLGKSEDCQAFYDQEIINNHREHGNSPEIKSVWGCIYWTKKPIGIEKQKRVFIQGCFQSDSLLPTGTVFTQFYSRGRSYERKHYWGQFLDGYWHGQGTWYHPNGQIRYKGEFWKGRPVGDGIKIFNAYGQQPQGSFCNLDFYGRLDKDGTGYGNIYMRNNPLGSWWYFRDGCLGPSRPKFCVYQGPVVYDAKRNRFLPNGK
jgi:hypothetical protein